METGYGRKVGGQRGKGECWWVVGHMVQLERLSRGEAVVIETEVRGQFGEGKAVLWPAGCVGKESGRTPAPAQSLASGRRSLTAYLWKGGRPGGMDEWREGEMGACEALSLWSRLDFLQI